MNPRPIRAWLAAAATEYIRGFIDGMPAGGLVGTAIGGALVNGTLVQGWPHQALAVAAGVFLSATAHASPRVWAWARSNPFPNILGETQPPTPQ